MSLAAVTELSNELRRLAVAGATLAAGDHRIAKLIPVLQKSGEKVPVFAKIAERAQALTESSRTTAASCLLEANALVMAVLKTQGKSSVDGEIQSLGKASLIGNKPISARSLEDVKEALRGGQGRMETIRNAIERGFFGDIRLAEDSVAALTDNSHEVANLAAETLVPPYGPGIAPMIVAKLNPAEKTPAARLIRALKGCHPEYAAEVARGVIERVEETSVEALAASLECLTADDADQGILLDHLKAKKKELRISALKALLEHDHPEAQELVLANLRGSTTKVREAIEALPSVDHPEALAIISELATGLFKGVKNGSATAVEVNTLILIIQAITRSEPSQATLVIAEQADDHLAVLNKRAQAESYAMRDRVEKLKRSLIGFLIKADPEAGSLRVARSILVYGPYHALSPVIHHLGPKRAWTALKGHLKQKEVNNALNYLFAPYMAYLYQKHPLPPASAWTVDWLKHALEAKMLFAVTYLRELDPSLVAKKVMAHKQLDPRWAALVLLAGPEQAGKVMKKLSSGDVQMKALCQALMDKDLGAALVALDDCRYFYDEDGLLETLNATVRQYLAS